MYHYTNDTLGGGTKFRLAKIRAYIEKWNANPRHVNYQLPAGMDGILKARGHGAGQWRKEPACRNATFKSGSDVVRWIERPDDLGFIFIGWSDELARLNHSGWFTDEYQSTTARGCVYALRGHGDNRWRIYRAMRIGESSYKDKTWQDDSGTEGAIVEDMPSYSIDAEDSRKIGEWREFTDMRAVRDAAMSADSMAEAYAEKSRDLDRAFQAGRMYHETRRENMPATARSIREYRQALKALPAGNDVAANLLKRSIEGSRDDLRKQLELLNKLKNGEFESRRDDYYLGFNTRNAEEIEQFNEGAESKVIG